MLCLVVRGFDADPDRVTEILDIKPTMVGRKGDIRRSGRPLRLSDWHYEGNAGRLTDGRMHNAALNHILHQLQGREDRFGQLQKLIRPNEVTIYGGLYHNADEQCGIWLNIDQMRLLAACGISWSLDLFCLDPS